jgi:4-hydroxybenzoate polyprenyltransferase
VRAAVPAPDPTGTGEERPHRLIATLSMIRFSHTVFALPFALLSAVLAAGGIPPIRTLVLILLAMVGARSAAMSFNRIADRDLDAANPRTRGREIPSGILSVRFTALFCTASVALFLFAAAQLNRLCLVLSPVALAVVLGYSLTKRFTSLSHLVLGLALALAAPGAWIAVTGRFALLPAVLGLAVLFWAAGFDVIYSLQDEEFDRREGLKSLPARFGPRGALALSTLFHATALVLFYAVFVLAGGGAFFGAGVVLAGVFLVRQHALVSPKDLSRVNAAFFTANGWLSVAILLCGAADVLLR